MNNISKLALVFVAGAAAGALAGLLVAPEKGSETRKKFAGKAKEFGDNIKNKAKEGWKQANAAKERMMNDAEKYV